MSSFPSHSHTTCCPSSIILSFISPTSITPRQLLPVFPSLPFLSPCLASFRSLASSLPVMTAVILPIREIVSPSVTKLNQSMPTFTITLPFSVSTFLSFFRLQIFFIITYDFKDHFYIIGLIVGRNSSFYTSLDKHYDDYILEFFSKSLCLLYFLQFHC